MSECLPVIKWFIAKVDGKETKHKTFALAVARLIRDSCNISAKPWGGLSFRKVTECNYFAICYARCVKGRNGWIVVDKVVELSFEKYWEDGLAGLFNVYGDRENDKKRLTAILTGFSRRRSFWWKEVERCKLT